MNCHCSVPGHKPPSPLGLGSSTCKPKLNLTITPLPPSFSFPCFEFILLWSFKAQLPVNGMNTIMAKLANNSLPNGPDLQHHWLTNIIHFTLKMTSTLPQVVEMTVTNNSSFQNPPHPDNHKIRTTEYSWVHTMYYEIKYFFQSTCALYKTHLDIIPSIYKPI